MLKGLPYASAAFCGALLFFLVQPLLGKYVLPQYGGGASVWTACMLFFQVLLLAGYAYAHIILTWLTPSRQVLVHLILLIVSVSQLPLAPVNPIESQYPALDILIMLFATTGFPGLLLASTAVLIQAWFADAFTDSSPYPLYAISNAGSLFALLAYPTIIEPWLTRYQQAIAWSCLFYLFLCVLVYCLWRRWQMKAVPEPDTASEPTARSAVYWLLWPACAVALMLSVTERMSTDLLAMPLLWVAPFSIYLLTYIVCFANERFFIRRPIYLAMLALIIGRLTLSADDPMDIRIYFPGHLLLLLCCCMVCHGELVRLKPGTDKLSTFYLFIAAGGMLGGLLVSLGAPWVFNINRDLELCIVWLLMMSLFFTKAKPLEAWRNHPLVAGGLSLALVATIASLLLPGLMAKESTEHFRNFYGSLQIKTLGRGTPDERTVLFNRRSPHGMQYADASRNRNGTGYYTHNSAAGILLGHKKRLPQKIGLVGLGVGTLLTFTQEGDQVRVYEINPDVTHIASTRFSYLNGSPATIKIIEGDARKSLEAEVDQAFDVLVLDAFNGDSIPLHLLTVEAFEVYLRHLKPDGKIIVLIDTWHMDFSSSLHVLGKRLGLVTYHLSSDSGPNEDWGSEWFMFVQDNSDMNIKAIRAESEEETDFDTPLITDEYTSFWHLIQWSALDW